MLAAHVSGAKRVAAHRGNVRTFVSARTRAPSVCMGNFLLPMPLTADGLASEPAAGLGADAGVVKKLF